MEPIMTYIDRGGVIVYVLIGLNILGFAIMLWKLVSLWIARRHQETMVEQIVSFVRADDHEALETSRLHSAINTRIASLEYGLGVVRTIASIAPLLGLLGTVVGVLNAFDAISAQGLGDPSVFSSGISVALITTVAGLIVALPHYIGYNYFISVLDHLEISIEKQVLEKL
jgi:biopolymer transport protein ExbB